MRIILPLHGQQPRVVLRPPPRLLPIRRERVRLVRVRNAAGR